MDELMNEAARRFVGQMQVLSAQKVVRRKHWVGGWARVLWHGSHLGRIVLVERKVVLKRLRNRAARGVSTRKYAAMVPRMAGTVGIAKLSVLGRLIRASRDTL